VLFKNIKLLQKLQMVYLFIIFFLEVLAKVIKKISVGSKTFDICLYGDSLLIEELSKVYNKKQVFKGIAFPTCISVN
jgi:methionine aminopeptidase